MINREPIPIKTDYNPYINGYKEIKKIYRYNKKDFEQCSKFLSEKWTEKMTNGINPFTKRQIKINGPTYYKIRNQLDRYKHISTLNKEEYLLETIKLTNEIKTENIAIEEHNLKIDDKCKIYNDEVKLYNEKILAVQRTVYALKDWESYIEYEGVKYGIPAIHNNIHRKNNCMGEFECIQYIFCECNKCDNWGGCGRPNKRQYKCSNCPKFIIKD
jgi:hypothetical protein